MEQTILVKKVPPFGKFKLTRAGKQYFVENYPTTKNEEIMEKLGIGFSSMQRLKRKYKLKKTKDFMREQQINACRAANKVGEATGYDAQRRGAISYYKKWCEEHPGEKWTKGFQPGHKPILSPEQNKKRIARRQEGIERDRRRVKLGLAPIGRLVSEYQKSKHEIYVRYRMRKVFGYITTPSDNNIYFDDTVKRNLAIEQRYKAEGFVFKPIERNDNKMNWTTIN